MRRRSFIKSLLSALGALFAPAFVPRKADATMYLAPFVPSLPATPFTAVYDTVQLGERLDVAPGWPGDGTTNYRANRSIDFKWPANSDDPLVTPWGSWIDANGVRRGTTAFASATIPSSGALPLSITWDVTTLMRKLVVSNTGVYITPETAGIGGAAGFASRQWDGDPTQKPKFHIVTSAGTYDVGALVDSQIVGSSVAGGMETFMRDPYCIQPDLSTVQGIITSATLTLWDVTGSQLRPCRYDCYYLDMPALVGDPVRQLGGQVQGIATSVATDDRDLASHPSVIFYPSFANQAACEAAGWSNVDFSNGKPDITTGGFVPWTDYGLTAMRMSSRYPGHPFSDGSTILSWRKYLPTAGSGSYQELYVRYLMKIDPDVFTGMNEGGVKLPGFGGDDRNVVPAADIWSYRMEHEKQSAANHGAYSEWIHAYDTDNQVGAGFAQNRPCSNVCLVEGRIYSIEQRVKLNTKTGSVYNSDGIIQIWINGVLVSSDTTRKITQTDDSHWIDNFFANFFHGGGGTPTQRIHYEFGGVCIATQYIGPPKVVGLPSWRPPAGYFADIPSSNVPADVFSPLYGVGSNAWIELFTRWEGGAFVRDYSRLGAFVCYGAGHENSAFDPNVQGSLTFDFSASPSAGKWEYHNAPTRVHYPAGVDPINQAGEFPDDGSLYAGHTYLGIHELPTSWGGGPKGSVVVLYDLHGTGGGGGALYTTHKLDLSQAVGGYSKLTEGFGCGTYGAAVMDEGRQGWWIRGYDSTVRFVSKTGAVGPVTTASLGGLPEPGFTLWPSKQVLLQIPGGRVIGGSDATVHQLYIYDIVTNTEQIVQTTGKPPVFAGDIAYGGVLEMATITPVNGGSGYAVNDTITFYTPDVDITLPQNSPKIVVTSVGGGGAVTGVAFFDFAMTGGYTLQQRGWFHAYQNWASGTTYAAGDKVFGSNTILYTSIGSGNIGHDPTTTSGFWTNQVPQVSQTGGGSGAAFTATWRSSADMFRPIFSGLCWCEPLRCVVGFDVLTQEIVTLTPPVGDIYGSAWTWARLSVAHWVAGDPSGQATLNSGGNTYDNMSGVYSRFQYIDKLKAFVLFTCVNSVGAYRPPQIINLPGLQ